jgi:ATP-dependent Clp protease ATP-binding subunit ClpC
MFERYTQRANRALFYARWEAQQTGSVEMTPEHLLLGLKDAGALHDWSGEWNEEIRHYLDRQRVHPGQTPEPLLIGMNVALRQVLTYAVEEADRLGHQEIRGEHLLLGIFRQGRSPAVEFLRKHGITPEKINHELQRPG